jgi:hypothetical protein
MSRKWDSDTFTLQKLKIKRNLPLNQILSIEQLLRLPEVVNHEVRNCEPALRVHTKRIVKEVSYEDEAL